MRWSMAEVTVPIHFPSVKSPPDASLLRPWNAMASEIMTTSSLPKKKKTKEGNTKATALLDQEPDVVAASSE